MNNISEYIRQQRYSYYDGESWEEMSKRVGEHIAKGEKKESEEKKWAEIFTHSLENGYLLPGGRVLANAGRIGAMLLNCFLIQPEDSRESLAKCFGDYFKILGTGGGCGLSYSRIRPKDSVISSGGDSSGVLGWGDIHNEISAKVKVGGGRRGATMFSLDYKHPEVEDFIISKNNVANKDAWNELLELVHNNYGERPDLERLIKEQVENKRLIETNISVEIDNQFLEMAEQGQSYDLTWRGESYKKVNAKEVWEKMMRNAVESGDPGTMNLGRANFYSNSRYFNELVGSNPCSEIILPNYGCCCLTSLVLPNFVKNGSFDWDLFKDQIHKGIRFLDNILSTTEYPLWEIKQVSTDERRIGLGFLGLHHAMLLMGLKYSSPEGIQFAEDMCRFMCRESYIASSGLASEKGSFPKYDRDKFLASNFVKERLDKDVQEKIHRQGMRNVAVLMVAPTGTTSLIARIKTGPVWSHGTSSGIESLPAVAYKRLIREKDGYKETKCVHAAVVSLYKSGFKNFSSIESSDMVDPETHFEIQARCAKYIDNSISKTILLPENYSEQELSRLWLHYGKLVTGTTVYRDGTYGKQPITPLELDDKIIEEAIIEEINEGCKSGQCS